MSFPGLPMPFFSSSAILLVYSASLPGPQKPWNKFTGKLPNPGNFPKLGRLITPHTRVIRSIHSKLPLAITLLQIRPEVYEMALKQVIYKFNVYCHGLFVGVVMGTAEYGVQMNKTQKVFTFATAGRIN